MEGNSDGRGLRRCLVTCAWIFAALFLYVFGYPLFIEGLEKIGAFGWLPQPAIDAMEILVIPLETLTDIPLYDAYIDWVLEVTG